MVQVAFGVRQQNTVEFKDLGLKRITQKVKEFGMLELNIGFLDEEIATRAVWQEFGTATIPQRSFLRSTMFEQRDKISTLWAKETRRMIKTPKVSAVNAVERVGISITKMVENKIRRSRSWAEPNAPSTVASKGNNYPLHDTGEMANSVRWTIKKRGQLLAQGGSNG